MTILDRASLVAAAQVDPWALLAQLRAGDPAEIESLAAAFYRAAGHTRDAAAATRQATSYARAGYTVGGAAPIDANADVRRTAATLDDAADTLPRIASVLTAVAEDLQTATRSVAADVQGLETTLSRIDTEWTSFFSGIGHHLPPDDQDAARAGYVSDAVAAVRSVGSTCTTAVMGYEHTLAAATKRMADLGYVPPADLREAGEQPTTPLPVGTDPTTVAGWWSHLTPAQQEYLLDHSYGALGRLKGLPAPVLDQANRHRITDDIASLQRQLADPSLDLHTRLTLTGRLVDDQGIVKELGTPGPGQPPAHIYVLAFDPTSPQHQTGVEISYGDPDTADNTAVVVPGTSHSAADLSTVGRDGRNLYRTMTGNRAVVVWLDGPEPPDLPHAALDSYANDSAPRLVADVAGLRASHVGATGDGGHLTLVGHSYGSYITGKALTEGAHPDDVVFIGSPGVGVDHAKDLGLDPHHVWDGEAGDDPILLTEKRFTPDPLTGTNPEDSDFGALHFDVSGSHGHSEYYKQGSNSLRNIALVADGDYAGVHTVAAPDYRGVRELPGDAVATVLNPWSTTYDAGKDLLTGHPIDAGKAVVHGVVTQGKNILHTGEDVVDGLGTGAKKLWDAL